MTAFKPRYRVVVFGARYAGSRLVAVELFDAETRHHVQFAAAADTPPVGSRLWKHLQATFPAAWSGTPWDADCRPAAAVVVAGFRPQRFLSAVMRDAIEAGDRPPLGFWHPSAAATFDLAVALQTIYGSHGTCDSTIPAPLLDDALRARLADRDEPSAVVELAVALRLVQAFGVV